MKAASDDNGDTPATGPQTPRPPCDGLIRVGSLVIDEPRRVAYRASRQLTLLPRQFALLIYLATHANKVVSRRAIARDVWGDETAMWTNVITVNINGLRKEIERDGLPVLLHTVRGRGYLLGELPG
jgi:two-component system copper resistance phosphate regulon response regulator CusR